MHSSRRGKLSQLATIVAAIAIIGSVATIALGGGVLGGSGPVVLQYLGCSNASAVNNADVRQWCDSLAESFGYQGGVVQPLTFGQSCGGYLNRTATCPEPGQLEWVCSGVGNPCTCPPNQLCNCF